MSIRAEEITSVEGATHNLRSALGAAECELRYVEDKIKALIEQRDQLQQALQTATKPRRPRKAPTPKPPTVNAAPELSKRAYDALAMMRAGAYWHLSPERRLIHGRMQEVMVLHFRNQSNEIIAGYGRGTLNELKHYKLVKFVSISGLHGGKGYVLKTQEDKS